MCVYACVCMCIVCVRVRVCTCTCVYVYVCVCVGRGGEGNGPLRGSHAEGRHELPCEGTVPKKGFDGRRGELNLCAPLPIVVSNSHSNTGLRSTITDSEITAETPE